MDPSSAQLSLLIQKVYTGDGLNGELASACVQTVCRRFLEMSSWTMPIRLAGDGIKTVLLGSANALLPSMPRWKPGIYTFEAKENAAQLKVFVDDDGFELHCSTQATPGNIQQTLLSLVDLAFELWEVIAAAQGLTGPGFAIRPYGLPYHRPNPPRHSPRWSLGDAAYFISDDFHREHALGDPEAIARLCAMPLPSSIIRKTQNGLTVIRVKGPADDGSLFAKQRCELEAWMCTALDLPLHPDYRENGDRRVAVLGKAAAPPFSFYDPVRRMAFKVMVEAPSGEIEAADLHDLEQILKVRTLGDGRTVAGAMVVFATREAALRNAAAVSACGASGALYPGDDQQLWLPVPERHQADSSASEEASC